MVLDVVGSSERVPKRHRKTLSQRGSFPVREGKELSHGGELSLDCRIFHCRLFITRGVKPLRDRTKTRREEEE